MIEKKKRDQTRQEIKFSAKSFPPHSFLPFLLCSILYISLLSLSLSLSPFPHTHQTAHSSFSLPPMNNRYLACVCAYGKGQEVHKNVLRPVRRKGERTLPAVPEWLSAYVLCFHFFIALGGNVLKCYTDCDAEVEASIEGEVEMNAE